MRASHRGIRIMILSADQIYTPIEQLVDRFLPTPAMRVELLRRMHPNYAPAPK